MCNNIFNCCYFCQIVSLITAFPVEGCVFNYSNCCKKLYFFRSVIIVVSGTAIVSITVARYRILITTPGVMHCKNQPRKSLKCCPASEQVRDLGVPCGNCGPVPSATFTFWL